VSWFLLVLIGLLYRLYRPFSFVLYTKKQKLIVRVWGRFLCIFSCILFFVDLTQSSVEREGVSRLAANRRLACMNGIVYIMYFSIP